MSDGELLTWGEAEASAFGRDVLVARHRLASLALFTDDGIVELLDRHPRENLCVMTMGDDPRRPDWRQGDASGLDGARLLEAVRKGRLWLNIKRVDVHHEAYRRLLVDLYGEIARKTPGFAPIWTAGTMLVSSPHAWVYYHLDIPANMLWHIRGAKRVWSYPADDARFAPPESLERIIAAEADEGLAYDPAFDAAATVVDLKPGEVVTWRQNAPHRISNLDTFNISLSTEHMTSAQRRRVTMFRANRMLRRRFGIPARSLGTEGLGPRLKEGLYFGFRALQRLGGERRIETQVAKSFRVDLPAPDCIGRLETP
ncbi:MAG: hypothetical protein FJX67_00225 [Alphaproteobacteria bacterium]|nr:hypothetical protein [Alphaproteobacteria bacterium]